MYIEKESLQSEIRAFRCPSCNELFEISNENKSYVTIHGSLTFGDKTPFLGTKGSVRICIKCLINLLNHHLVEKEPLKVPLKDGDLPPLYTKEFIRKQKEEEEEYQIEYIQIIHG